MAHGDQVAEQRPGNGPEPAGEGARSSSPSPTQRELLLLSVLALFLELLIIRWLATEVRIFAYFKNLPLMSAFLGLGLGFLWTDRKRDYFHWSAPGLLSLSMLLIFALGLGLTYLSFVDPLKFLLFGVRTAGDGHRLAPMWTTLRSLAIMLGIFALSTSIFVGLGQRMGKLFDRLPPLTAYSINIAGSLIGSLLFTGLSWMRTGPGVWLVAAGLMLTVLNRRVAHFAVIVLGILYALSLGPYIARANYGADYVKTVWSPYYRIDVAAVRQPGGPWRGEKLGYNIYINYDSFQSILDCSPASLSRFPRDVQEKLRATFATPYRVLPRPGGNVLVLGSGTGNDVAAALRCGAGHVDAVEIDPSIVEIGRELHPEHPYQSSKVTAHVMDARTFLKNCRGKYDVIVFAALDSHTAFSSLSSLRLDNYIFTREAMNQAARLLDEQGIIAVSFVALTDWLWDRHAKALTSATGMRPYGYCDYKKQVSGLLIAGPGLDKRAPASSAVPYPPRSVNLQSTTPPATDDWPFLFLPDRQLPALYALPILSVLLLGFLPVASQLAGGARKPLNWQMFGLGMGFMLLEVRAMADLSLLFGSTWVVNSVIISAVMIVILIGNYIAWRWRAGGLAWLGPALLISLSATGFVNTGELSAMGPLAGGAAGAGLYLFPLIFSATIFALLFKNADPPTEAFAFNLVGGLVGVCLEYLSMQFGIRALGWLATGIYTGVLIIHLMWRERRQAPATQAHQFDGPAEKCQDPPSR